MSARRKSSFARELVQELTWMPACAGMTDGDILLRKTSKEIFIV
jgi:hypothetical protein